jgi:hypothetical protein
MGTIYGDNDKENDDDYLPTIDEILYAKLQKEGFEPEDPSPEHTVGGVEVSVVGFGTGISVTLIREVGGPFLCRGLSTKIGMVMTNPHQLFPRMRRWSLS